MAQTTYEEMPYATFALRLADPNRLAAIARLYGVEVPAPNTASVLEIGCGTGANIIHLAERYPGSRCVGVDISERHIAEGHQIALGSACSNVELRCGDIRNAALGHGEFDFIICHGVYSWVAPSVRQHLLSLISSALSENGIALVSYNVLPGWRSRGILRDIMQTGAMHRVLSTGSYTPETRLDGAMELLRLVAEKRGEAGDLYGTYIREGIERFQDSHPSYLVHEYLEECNEPFLFSTFMRDAELHGLQFVSEAKPSMMSVDEMGEKVASYLDGLGEDIIAREQCIDVLRNRMFRETIVCKGSIPLKRDLKASVFTSLYFVSDLRKIEDEERESVYRDVITERIVRTPNDEHSALLQMIGEAGYAGSSFAELKDRFTATTAGRYDERAVMHGLVRLWRWGLIDVALERAPIRTQLRGEARVSRLARYQASTGERFVTSLQHRSFELTAAEREMVVACDGTRRLEDVLGGSTDRETALGRLLALGFLYA
jgi:SAM-dependent methyltransferase/methyltransferase-like protein